MSDEEKRVTKEAHHDIPPAVREIGSGGHMLPPPADDEPAAAFCQQIQSDARDETEAILARARHSAEKKRQGAAEKAEKEVRTIRQEAEAQAKAIESRALAGVSLESKKLLLKAQGEIVDGVFEGVRARLKGMRSGKRYADFLKDLTVQAIIMLGEEECLLVPACEERDWFDASLLADIEQLVEQRTARKVKLSVSDDSLPEGAGVQVYSATGTSLFDNTIPVRFERIADELKVMIVREVFVSGERESIGQPSAN